MSATESPEASGKKATHVPHFSRLGCALRRRLWRIAFALAGGLRVTGSPPSRAAVVVSNHKSHGDTAALLAALPASRLPVFVAAADYWFDVRVRRVLVMSLAAALPVRRDSRAAYEAMRDVALPHLAAGGIVVVYPEGTRSQDGEVGTFRSGALRLAVDAEVDLVPAAVLGTEDVLPKHGRFSPEPVEVRFDTPINPGQLVALGPDGLRARVCELLAAGPVKLRVSRTWAEVARLVNSRTALVLAFAWGAAEAMAWPITAEMFLLLFAAAVPRRVLTLAVVLAAGSVVGVAGHVWLVRQGVDIPLPLTTPRMQTTAANQLAQGSWTIWHQAFNGIPVKVYAAEAGRSGIDAVQFIAATALERSSRILVVGAAIALVARAFAPWLHRLYGPYLLAVSAAFALLFSATVIQWS